MKKNTIIQVMTLFLIGLFLAMAYLFNQTTILKNEFDSFSRLNNTIKFERNLELYYLSEKDITSKEIKENISIYLKFDLSSIESKGLNYIFGKGNKKGSISLDNNMKWDLPSGNENILRICKAYNVVKNNLIIEYGKKYPKTIKELNSSCGK